MHQGPEIVFSMRGGVFNTKKILILLNNNCCRSRSHIHVVVDSEHFNSDVQGFLCQ